MWTQGAFIEAIAAAAGALKEDVLIKSVREVGVMVVLFYYPKFPPRTQGSFGHDRLCSWGTVVM